MSLGRWPLNANELDACCRCARLLPPARTRAIDSLEQLTDDELWLWAPVPRGPEQYACGKCVKEMLK